MFGSLFSFAISLLVGLLIGIERERSHIGKYKAIGVRTFALLALLGTLASILDNTFLTILLSSFVFLLLLLSYYRSTMTLDKTIDIGITTETSAALIFCIGYIIPAQPIIAIIISAIVLLLLIERKRLHSMARRKFKPHEIETIIILIVLVFGLLIVLPDKTIDPWGYFNPRNFCVLVATIAAIQLVSYIAIRLFGQRFGIALTGFLGGLVSSTAVFATLPATIKDNPQFSLTTIASALLAVVAMLIDIIIILAVASQALLAYIIWPIILMMLISIGFAYSLLYFQKSRLVMHNPAANPHNLSSIFRTSIFIALILIFIAITKRYIGPGGILLVSFLGGLFEIHGVTLATALL